VCDDGRFAMRRHGDAMSWLEQARITAAKQTTTSQILRGRLEQVRARYDHGAVPQALFEALKALEREIAWTEYKGGNHD
jgi:hypothetical protein